MLKIVNNLMMINKIIIFCENMLEEDIDSSQFSEKLYNDINFINYKIIYLFEEYTKNILEFKRENIQKIYYSTMKRFLKLINKTIGGNWEISKSSLEAIRKNIEEIIISIKNLNDRIVLSNTEKQCINEEEYAMLLKEIDDT